MLTNEQQGRFRARLERQREALRAEAADVRRQVAAPDASADAIIGWGNPIAMPFAHEQAIGELVRLQQTLAHVEQVLRRIAAGAP